MVSFQAMNTDEFRRLYGDDMAPPAPVLLAGELLTPARLLLDPSQWRRLPKNIDAGAMPVLLLPGLGGGPASMWPICRYLRQCNFRTWDWGQGINRGDMGHVFPALLDRLAGLNERLEQPLALVGWSLGGYLARELARERPDLVSRVITLGTPVVGGPKYTSTGALYKRQGVALDSLEARMHERYARPLQRPVRALYTRADGVVAWRACIDRVSDDIRHIPVRGSHVGLGFSKQVLRRLPHLLLE